MNRFLLIVFAGLIALGAWSTFKKKENNVIDDAAYQRTAEIFRAGGSEHLRYDLKKPFVETYMVFGASVSEKGPGFFTDAHVGGIPWHIAKPLLRRYPDLERCSSPGSAEAKRAVVSVMAIFANPDLLQQMQRVEKDFHASLTGKRICARLTGHNIDSSSLRLSDGTSLPVDGRQKIVLLNKIETVPCL